MFLRVYLPVDRALPGFMRLFDDGGAQRLYDIPCRGKADSKNALANNNPKRDPTLPWGDTPAGRYEPARVLRFNPPRRTFGKFAILMEGIDGDAGKAKVNGRTGLAIHARRGNDRLMATYGCVRVFDRDMAMLAEAIGDAEVAIEVIDCDTWPPGGGAP